MKVKDAISQIKESQVEGKEYFAKLCTLFRNEVDSRVELRAHGKAPTDDLVTGVVEEVCDWASKVGRSLEMAEDMIKLCVGTERGAAFAKYRIADPKAARQLLKMRQAYISGRPLFEVVTHEGLDAICNMMMGKAMSDAREVSALIGDKNICFHGVEARFCKSQETIYDSRIGLPTSVEQLLFVCNADPVKCDWWKEQQ